MIPKANNTPYTSPPAEGGYKEYPKRVEGYVVRGRSESFNDFFSQPRIFWNSLSTVEKQHTIEAFSYQLGRVKNESVRQQNIELLGNVDTELATVVAENVGVNPPSSSPVPISASYPSLSQFNTPKTAVMQKVGVLIGNGFNDAEVTNVLNNLRDQGVVAYIISQTLGTLTGANGTQLNVNETFLTYSPYLVDALYVVGGSHKQEDRFNDNILKFVNVAYTHYKPIGVASTGQSFVQASANNNLSGVVYATNSQNFAQEFIAAIAQQRFWDRR